MGALKKIHGWYPVGNAWLPLKVDSDGKVVISSIPAHKTSHELGGSDKLSVAGLSGLLANSQTPLEHKTSHQDGGSDELSVEGLSGLLANYQNPLSHASSHNVDGSDIIDYIPSDGWIPVLDSWTYLNPHAITVPSGAPYIYRKGDKIKLFNQTIKYFYIEGVSDHILIITGGSIYSLTNYVIISPFYSPISNPLGIPFPFDYIPSLDLGSAVLSGYSYAFFSIVNQTVFVYFEAAYKSLSGSLGPIGVSLPINGLDLGDIYYHITCYDGSEWILILMRVSPIGKVFYLYKTASGSSWLGNEGNIFLSANFSYNF